MALAQDAGHGRLSGYAIAAGVSSAFGAFAVILGAAVAVAEAAGVDARSFSRGGWRAVALGCGVAAAVVACLAWSFGGYVAGRMARRAGARHGLLVFVASVIVLAVAAGIVWAEHGVGTVRDALRHQGAPTARHDWWDIAALTGLLTFVGALAGSVLGGIRGERWHQHLVERAIDPAFGPEAEAREAAATSAAAAHERVGRTVDLSGHEEPVTAPTHATTATDATTPATASTEGTPPASVEARVPAGEDDWLARPQR